ncbi:hypothetical protein, partial [Coprococcus eutactus]|uniref:hypothetical protein n=1 Tax=Coprococcus eutactus TaxID=33043 RepID=UPI00210AAD36
QYLQLVVQTVLRQHRVLLKAPQLLQYQNQIPVKKHQKKYHLNNYLPKNLTLKQILNRLSTL